MNFLFALFLALWPQPTEHLRHYTVYVDDSTLLPGQHEAIERAEKDWTDHISSLRFLPAASCEEATICIIGATDLPEPIAGVTQIERGRPGGFIQISVLLNLAFQVTATHEIGHAMGLEHGSEGSVMCRSLECASWTVTSADVDAWYAVRGWTRP